MGKIFWLQFKGQCGNETDIRINIPNGITIEQAKELNDVLQGIISDYGEKYGDYSDFDYHTAIEEATDKLNIEYHYPQVDYTIYL